MTLTTYTFEFQLQSPLQIESSNYSVRFFFFILFVGKVKTNRGMTILYQLCFNSELYDLNFVF